MKKFVFKCIFQIRALRERSLLIPLLLILTQISTTALGDDPKFLAITIDDPAVWESDILTPQQRDERILGALQQQNNLKAFLFVTGRRIDNPEGRDLLERWSKRGHFFGNHSYSHFDYDSNGVSFEKYANDLLAGQKVIENYPNFRKMYRFPFLKEGSSQQKISKMQHFLKQNGYKNGWYTIDASDWYIDERMAEALKKDPHASLEKYRDYYLSHTLSRATQFDSLLKKNLGPGIRNTLLIHHNLLNALFLSDLLEMFKANGWQLIDADQAYQHHASQNPRIPRSMNASPAATEERLSCESVMSSIVKERRYDGETGYLGEAGEAVKTEMNQLGL